MSLLDEYDKLKPTRRDWRLHDSGDNYIWDGDEKYPLAGFVRTRSDAEFILFAYKYMDDLINSIKKAKGIIDEGKIATEKTSGQLREVRYELERILGRVHRLEKCLKDLIEADNIGDLFKYQDLVKVAQGILNETSS